MFNHSRTIHCGNMQNGKAGHQAPIVEYSVIILKYPLVRSKSTNLLLCHITNFHIRDRAQTTELKQTFNFTRFAFMMTQLKPILMTVVETAAMTGKKQTQSPRKLRRRRRRHLVGDRHSALLTAVLLTVFALFQFGKIPTRKTDGIHISWINKKQNRRNKNATTSTGPMWHAVP